MPQRTRYVISSTADVWERQMPTITDALKVWTSQLADYVEIAAAVIIGLAAVEASLRALWVFTRRHLLPEAKEDVRLRLGRWLAVALEFELAADILRTAIAPTWTQIGQLAAIIILRTLLNYFLQKEIDKAAQRRSGAASSGPLAQRPPQVGVAREAKEARQVLRESDVQADGQRPAPQSA